MTPREIMIPDWLWESIQDQAERNGVATGEHVRVILKSSVDTDSKTDVLTRIDELEERIKRLESERVDNLAPGIHQGQATSGRSPPAAEERRETQDSDTQDSTTDAVEDSNQPVPLVADEPTEADTDYIKIAVNDVITPKEISDPEELKMRKAAAAAALKAAVDAEATLSRRELSEQFYDDGNDADRYYEEDIKPVLKKVGEYSPEEGGYVFPDIGDSYRRVNRVQNSGRDAPANEKSGSSDHITAVEPSTSRTVDSKNTGKPMDGDTQQNLGIIDELSEEYSDYVLDAVDSIFPSQDRDSKQLRLRMTTAAAALKTAVDADAALGRRELVDQFYDYDRYTSKDSLWIQDLRPVLQEVGTYDRGVGGYVFPSISPDSEQVGHLNGNEDEQPARVAQSEENPANQPPATAEEASETQGDVIDQIFTDITDSIPVEPDTEITSEQELPPVDHKAREQLEQAVPSSNWVAEQRADEILKMYNLLRQQGEADKNELLAVIDIDAAQYATTESMWLHLIEKRNTLQSLPGVEAPPKGKTTWTYTDN